MTPMLVQCSSCLTEFELDPAKVPAAGVRARCSVCSAVISVPAPRVEAKPAEVELPAHEQVATELPAAETAPAPKPAAESQRTQPEPQHAASPVAAETESSHVSASTAQPPSVPAEAPAPPEPAPQEPATPAPVAAASESWEHRADTGADRTWGARTATESAHTPPPTSPSTEPTAEGHRRSINPFLTRDPALRAKRLARALVSDIVAYHPARHAEGLRDGTLKTLFRDEIKKSYEEYVDQVGRDFASTTTHFQDALNDVLASGKKLF